MPASSSQEDFADFIRRVRAGDMRAAEELVSRYGPEIRFELRLCLRQRNVRLRRVVDSMDIVQSVMASFFVRAAVGEFQLDDPDRLAHLLMEMARHKLADYVKYYQRQRRDLRREKDLSPGHDVIDRSSETPSQLIAGRELLQMLHDQLSEDERRLAEMRLQGLEWAAIAGVLGGTPEARRKQLARAVARVGSGLDLG